VPSRRSSRMVGNDAMPWTMATESFFRNRVLGSHDFENTLVRELDELDHLGTHLFGGFPAPFPQPFVQSLSQRVHRSIPRITRENTSVDLRIKYIK
jgi:hypothetical protein